jgi:hypothetical protein
MPNPVALVSDPVGICLVRDIYCISQFQLIFALLSSKGDELLLQCLAELGAKCMLIYLLIVDINAEAWTFFGGKSMRRNVWYVPKISKINIVNSKTIVYEQQKIFPNGDNEIIFESTSTFHETSFEPSFTTTETFKISTKNNDIDQTLLQISAKIDFAKKSILQDVVIKRKMDFLKAKYNIMQTLLSRFVLSVHNSDSNTMPLDEFSVVMNNRATKERDYIRGQSKSSDSHEFYEYNKISKPFGPRRIEPISNSSQISLNEGVCCTALWDGLRWEVTKTTNDTPPQMVSPEDSILQLPLHEDNQAPRPKNKNNAHIETLTPQSSPKQKRFPNYV